MASPPQSSVALWGGYVAFGDDNQGGALRGGNSEEPYIHGGHALHNLLWHYGGDVSHLATIIRGGI